MVTTFLDSQNITSIELYNLIFFKLHEAERRWFINKKMIYFILKEAILTKELVDQTIVTILIEWN